MKVIETDEALVIRDATGTVVVSNEMTVLETAKVVRLRIGQIETGVSVTQHIVFLRSALLSAVDRLEALLNA